MEVIGRRGLLQGVLLLAGVVAAPPVAARGLFEGPESLAPGTMVLLTAVADTIIPPTDTPGAAGAGVPAMFDKLLANWASPARRTAILAAMKGIDDEARQASGTGFAALPPARRFELLRAHDKSHAADPGYSRLKELVITLYYFSEVGATVELRYEHSPGAWEPSIPVTADTRNYGA